MARTPIASTTLLSVGYDPATLVLQLEFRSGELYHYHAVPAHLHRQLMAAESKGRFFNFHIRDHFSHVHLPRALTDRKTI